MTDPIETDSAPPAPLLTAPRWFGGRSAPFLPMSRAEMDALGWDACDVILITGDAYIDHPSFGMAIVGRLLEAYGYRVGIIAQPDWQSAEPFTALGRPTLYFGITAGNMDSMVNKYTSDRRIRSNDAYTPDGASGRRPDRASLVYAQRAREAYAGVPIVLGGIEASLRRIAHYDHWSEKIRRSILFDARGDILLYGNAERALVALTDRVAAGEHPSAVHDLRGTAYSLRADTHTHREVAAGERVRSKDPRPVVIRLPSYDEVRAEKVRFAQASRALHLETNPGNALPLVQAHGDRDLWLTPPPIPLTTAELDALYELPFARAPHPRYGDAHIPAWEMIRHSVIIERGCFGGCSFCSITEHEGRIIQRRSKASILREVERIRDSRGFNGTISDLGGPTANMWGLHCKDPEVERRCRKPSCLFPRVCPNLKTDHSELIELYREARQLPGIKRIHVASGVRFDLAIEHPEYVRELTEHHVGGRLKIAPEHVAERPLNAMMKPGIDTYDRFEAIFQRASKAAGKRQELIPYFIAAHPGTRTEDMVELALWLKARGKTVDQVQTFLPTPMSSATAMYHSEHNPLDRKLPSIDVPKKGRLRRIHKAILRYHDPEGWKLVREGLRAIDREDLIGLADDALVPPEGHRPRPSPHGHRPKKQRGSNASRGSRSRPQRGKRPSKKRR